MDVPLPALVDREFSRGQSHSEVPQMAPDASLQTAERSLPSSGGKVVCGSQGELGSYCCPKSGHSLQASSQQFYVIPKSCFSSVELLAVISHFPQKQRSFHLTPPTAHVLLAARKEAPAEVSTEVGFNLSELYEESSPGQSRCLEKKTVFLPKPDPGRHVQHFVKLIAP